MRILTLVFVFIFAQTVWALAGDVEVIDTGSSKEGPVIPMGNNYHGPDVDFVRSYFFTDLYGMENDSAAARARFYREYREKFSRYDDPEEVLNDIIEVGYFDLNGDGIDEMLVAFANSTWFCGQGVAGCSLTIFARRHGQWSKIGDTLMGGARFTDERIGGYHTLKSSEMGLRWNESDGQYREFCIDYMTRVEGGGRCLKEKG